METNNKDFFNLVESENLEDLKLLYIKNNKSSLVFTNEKGQTLLHIASKNKNENTLPIIQFLLENNVDPLSVDESFNTALDIAKKNNNVPASTLMKHYINLKNI